MDDEDDEDEKEIPGAYNPVQYANLPVSQELKEMFCLTQHSGKSTYL